MPPLERLFTEPEVQVKHEKKGPGSVGSVPLLMRNLQSSPARSPPINVIVLGDDSKKSYQL